MLPVGLRVASGIVAVVVYPAIALVVLASSGVLADDWGPGAGRMAMRVLTVFFTLGAVMNVVSRSRPERIWAPVSLAMAACRAVIAARRKL